MVKRRRRCYLWGRKPVKQTPFKQLLTIDFVLTKHQRISCEHDLSQAPTNFLRNPPMSTLLCGDAWACTDQQVPFSHMILKP
jgi:hypothetical protein